MRQDHRRFLSPDRRGSISCAASEFLDDRFANVGDGVDTGPEPMRSPKFEPGCLAIHVLERCERIIRRPSQSKSIEQRIRNGITGVWISCLKALQKLLQRLPLIAV